MTKLHNRILLTGASGFVGRSLATSLIDVCTSVRCAVRTELDLPGAEIVHVPSIDNLTVWNKELKGIDTIIHCAGRAHIMNELFPSPLHEYRKINVGGTINLARQAVAAGVKRFIFLSSVKVNGEQTLKGQPFTENDLPSPQNPYAISKFEAEKALFDLARETDLEVVVIRPTLVYGCGVKANFFTMLRMVKLGMPLPFGSIENKRSFVYLENLNSLIIRCIDHPKAANQLFLASDGNDLSTTELLRHCGEAMGVSVYLIPIPESWCMLSASLLGQSDAIQRLCGSLQVDISKSKKLLGWNPPISVQAGLQKTVQNLLI
ncbi:nucleoside-diphosphate-sugar epimerase [Oxalobacteraceae bacterium GrIS 2.11]